MKLSLILFCLMTLAATCSPTRSGEGGLEELTGFGDNPGNLKAWHYVPKQLPEEAALVLVLHGCGQNAAEMARLSGWNALAEEYRFAILYPEQQVSNNRQNCFNWFLPEDMQRDSGEALSIRHMLKHMLEEYNLDEDRVYVSGISAGGAMAAVMMAAYPGQFDAGAVHAGVPYGAARDLQTGLQAMQGQIIHSPSEWAAKVNAQHPTYNEAYPSVAIFHGTDDPLVSPVNASELAKQWGFLHGIDFSNPTEQPAFEDNEKVKRLSFTGEDGTVKLVKYDIQGLGHAIAVDPGKGQQQGGATGRFAKDVDFFSSYWTAAFFGLTAP